MVDQHIDDFIQVGRRRWDVSCFIFYRIPFTTLRVVLVQKGLSCHLQRTGLHMHIIQILGNPMMIWSQTYSIHLRMTCHNILMMILSHPLRVVMNILLVTRICSMKISNHHRAQILMDTRSWPAQSSLGLTLPNKSIFILGFLAGICR
jgi:hypothetical protein